MRLPSVRTSPLKLFYLENKNLIKDKTLKNSAASTEPFHNAGLFFFSFLPNSSRVISPPKLLELKAEIRYVKELYRKHNTT